MTINDEGLKKLEQRVRKAAHEFTINSSDIEEQIEILKEERRKEAEAVSLWSRVESRVKLGASYEKVVAIVDKAFDKASVDDNRYLAAAAYALLNILSEVYPSED